MLSYKIRLDLNNKQATLAKKHAGVARHAYNWGLAQCQVAHQHKIKHPSAIDLHKRLNAEVKTVHKWYYEVSKCAPQEALRNVEKAYKRFFQKKSAFPKFKKKGRQDSFYLDGIIEVRANKIKLPRFGWLRLSETIEKDKNGKYPVVKNVTVSCRAGHWYKFQSRYGTCLACQTRQKVRCRRGFGC
jgi:putative transposase